jgi:dihydroneopterin aldolase
LRVTARRIRLEEFSLRASIGIHPEEKTARQRVLVTVELEVTAIHAGKGDRIDRALDYDFLRREIAALAKDRHYNLQETLAEDIARLCLARRGVRGVRVATSKPDVYPDCKSIGFEIEARR